jgi:type II secretory pathway predicted ATPase ExeA
VTNRRTRFREYMARLNAAASPQQALDSGYYVMPPAELSVAHELAARLELQPASTHLVIGGVGSGKTTELLAARHRLANDEEVAAIYIDVSEKHDLAKFRPHVLHETLLSVLATDLEARQSSPPSVQLALRNYAIWLDQEFSSTEEDRAIFTGLMDAYREIKRTPIVFMDSLDRLPDPLQLEAALIDNKDLIRSGELGLVLAASIRFRHGLNRSLRDLFDQSYNTPYVDTNEAPGLAFLSSVLRARVPATVLDDESCQRLGRLSGGVLRDLLTLTQAAVNEAYVRGGDQVTSQHIEIAAEGFGRKQLLGLDSEEIETLQRVRARGTFVQTSAKDLGLLLTRHVLEYQDSNGKTIYRVHPTLQPLLEQIAGAP